MYQLNDMQQQNNQLSKQDQQNPLNNLVSSKIKLKLQNDLIEVSNILKVQKENEKIEENENELKQKVNKNNIYHNKPHNSFIQMRKSNQLDDLQELTKNSEKLYQAVNSSKFENYKDKLFPHNYNSLKGYGERFELSQSYLKSLIWLRPFDFLIGKICIYKSINPKDIFQGTLGDCYLLAALSSIAQYPQRLERLFLIKELNKAGYYAVALCINGIWEEVIVDDYFPCSQYNKKPAFNSTRTNELWMMLIEKAWAKIHGGYLNIAAGLTREALRDLTGASCKTYFTSDVDNQELWQRLKWAYQQKYILTAGSDDLSYNGNDGFISKIGLAGSHAYSLLGVYELGYVNGVLKKIGSRKQGGGVRLVKLRNPWGKGEWKGSWGDNDKKWSNHLKRELGMSKKEDGVFYMGYEDFVKYFSDVQICFYQDGFKYSAIRLQSQSQGKTYLRFEVRQKGRYYLSINQKNRRFFEQKKKYCYSYLSFIVVGEIRNVLYFVESNIKKDKENWVSNVLPVGVYYVVISTPWLSFVNEFSFSVYGIGSTKIDQIQKGNLPNQFYKKVFIEHANREKNFKKLNNFNTYFSKWNNNSGLGYLYFENKDPKMEIDITVEMIKSKNIKLLEPYKGLRPNFTLQPLQKNVIAYEPIFLPCIASIRIMSSQKQSKKLTLNLAKEQGKNIQRKLNGKNVGIQVYAIKTDDGIIYQYVNKSKFYLLREEMIFDLRNCGISGSSGNSIEIVVYPGEEKIVFLQRLNPQMNYSARIARFDYSIEKINQLTFI